MYDIHNPMMNIISTVSQTFFSVLCFVFWFFYNNSKNEADEAVSFVSIISSLWNGGGISMESDFVLLLMERKSPDFFDLVVFDNNQRSFDSC